MIINNLIMRFKSFYRNAIPEMTRTCIVSFTFFFIMSKKTLVGSNHDSVSKPNCKFVREGWSQNANICFTYMLNIKSYKLSRADFTTFLNCP